MSMSLLVHMGEIPANASRCKGRGKVGDLEVIFGIHFGPVEWMQTCYILA